MRLELLVAADITQTWLAAFIARHHLERVVSRGRMHYPAGLPGFVATRDGEPIALVTYRVEGDECEIVTLHSDVQDAGAGTALIERVRQEASQAGCRRLWLITTNDNTHAIRFYQRRGFRIAQVHAGAIDVYRRDLKPEIPLTGFEGIAIRDEVEFEMDLAAG